MKKEQHTPPDIPHDDVRSKQKGPERKPKALGLTATGHPECAVGRARTGDNGVLEKSLQRADVDLGER